MMDGFRANKSLSGGGYAKRSDEEGFGALYGGNQSLSKEDEDKIVHANVPGTHTHTYLYSINLF